MEKTFTVAGTSNLDGVIKFRFANDLESRVKVLLKNGHTDVRLLALPYAMTKEAAIAFITAADTAPAAAEPTVAEPTEQEIAEEIAAIVAEGRPRNAKGHFVSAAELRAMAIAQLTE
jgi:hypothetical protein